MYGFVVFLVYAVYLIFMSSVTIFLYGIDKKLALSGKTRIKEKTLLAFSVFGGATGAMAGRIIFSHKTKKVYFSLVIYVSFVLQAAVFLLALMAMIASLK